MNSDRCAKFLWVSASPSLKYFHRRLLNQLSKAVAIEFWEFFQTADEDSSIEGAVKLLHEHLSQSDTPTHLIGHGISGTIALTYARRYPSKVASLTLLSVAVQPGINWHSYYYDRLWSLPSSRQYILKLISSELFPDTCARYVSDLVDRLERDLLEAPSNHSLFRSDLLSPSGVDMPLMICGSQDDRAISVANLYGWKKYFKSPDKMWIVATGGHFFHHCHPELTRDRLQHFWQQLEPDIEFHQLISLELK